MVRKRRNPNRTKVRQKRKHPYKPSIKSAEAKSHGWSGKKTLRENYATLGLASVVNEPIVQKKHKIETINILKLKAEQQEQKSTENKTKLVDEWADNDSERALTGHRLTAERRPDHWMSDEEMRYIKPLIAKHGDDYQKMFRDIKLNTMQETQKWIEKKVKQYHLFTASKEEKE